MKVKLVEASTHIHLFRINVGIVLDHVPQVNEFLVHLDGIQALENEMQFIIRALSQMTAYY